MSLLTSHFAFIEGLGGPEIMLIMVIVLVLFGGEKLPGFARGLGKSIREFKKAAAGVEEEFKRALEEDEKKTTMPPPTTFPPYPPAASLPEPAVASPVDGPAVSPTESPAVSHAESLAVSPDEPLAPPPSTVPQIMPPGEPAEVAPVVHEIPAPKPAPPEHGDHLP